MDKRSNEAGALLSLEDQDLAEVAGGWGGCGGGFGGCGGGFGGYGYGGYGSPCGGEVVYGSPCYGEGGFGFHHFGLFGECGVLGGIL